MDDLKKALEGKIDFQGQRLADRIGQELIVMGALLALLIGFAFDSLLMTMYLYAFVVVLACVLVIPPWPFYNRHKTRWLPNRPQNPAVEQAGGGTGEVREEEKEKKS